MYLHARRRAKAKAFSALFVPVPVPPIDIRLPPNFCNVAEYAIEEESIIGGRGHGCGLLSSSCSCGLTFVRLTTGNGDVELVGER